MLSNIIGSLLRDIIVYTSNDFVEYQVEDNTLTYKSWIPFTIKLGNYRFLPKKAFNSILNN